MSREPEAAGLSCSLRMESAELADRVVAEAFEAGALGVVEVSVESGIELIAYLGAGGSGALRERVAEQWPDEVQIGADQTIEAQDWSESWKAGLEAVEISDRLVVRPSFVEHAAKPGQRTLLIDPKQAFGTGGHASTRLILEWVDALYASPARAAQLRSVLDVGTGTGVLAMAALALGAERAVGFDLDAVAVIEAASLAESNGLAERFQLFAGPIEALETDPFDLALVNLLRREVLPIVAEIAVRVKAGGRVVLSGLLEDDRAAVVEAFAPHGFEVEDERALRDGDVDHWVSPLLVKRTAAD